MPRLAVGFRCVESFVYASATQRILRISLHRLLAFAFDRYRTFVQKQRSAFSLALPALRSAWCCKRVSEMLWAVHCMLSTCMFGDNKQHVIATGNTPNMWIKSSRSLDQSWSSLPEFTKHKFHVVISWLFWLHDEAIQGERYVGITLQVYLIYESVQYTCVHVCGVGNFCELNSWRIMYRYFHPQFNSDFQVVSKLVYSAGPQIIVGRPENHRLMFSTLISKAQVLQSSYNALGYQQHPPHL